MQGLFIPTGSSRKDEKQTMIATIYGLTLDDKKHPVLMPQKDVVYQNNLTCADNVVQLCNDSMQLSYRAEEYVIMVATTMKGDILGIFEVSHGTINAALCNPREIYLRAFVVGAGNIILIHNHPSGNCTPSDDDLKTAKRMTAAGKLLGINLLDYIIVGNNNYYSAHDDSTQIDI